MFLRQLIHDTAAETEGVGELEEALRWGEPSFLTTQSKSGSLIRINTKDAAGDRYAVFFHCQTKLVPTFRKLYPRAFTFEGDRALVFGVDDPVPVEALRDCIRMALTYHQAKKDAGKVRREAARARRA
ncbi:DUF1801 domain-containing protein [Corallococcus sp. BB11-1]|uniref:DUF1801 domain-containing protein n=1 Tax=Corallococcus sp. BB11-1 TaxID=2996783 RepID=UPI00226F38AE|nr:DUF1801 domain-containing protein [Corallococcus sp. BB11-1]MCY1033268.1 DUF1801 domain-containing protein [Corallococcus sp. BB11-1]